MKFLKIVSISALLVASQSGFAEASGPEAIAVEYFQVMQTDGFSEVAQFMHPNALKDFKEMLLPVFVAEADSGKRQLTDLMFGDEVDVAALKKITPEKFMNGFMNLVSAQTGSENISFDDIEVLGTVKEGGQRHVLTRITVGSGELALTQFEVLSFTPYQDSWRLQLNGQMKGLATALRSQIN